MGCDIHLYIEYYSDRWNDFGGRINPGRNYDIFERMAGVRGSNALFPKRGETTDYAYWARNDNQLYISEIEGEGYVTLEMAKRWVESGYSRYINNHEGKPTWVTNPDWHSHSWLTTQEFEKVLEGQQYCLEYNAVLAVMQYFESQNKPARIVFWFDN